MIPRLVFTKLSATEQRNFQLIQDFFDQSDFFKFDYKFFKFSIDRAVTNFAIPHNYGQLPTDLLPTSISGDITFHYPNFTDKFIYITTTGAASFRGMLGKYKETL